jgi:hypothetical protein
MEEPVDEDIQSFSRDQLIEEVRRLRAGIRAHRDWTSQESVDTSASSSGFLEILRTDSAQMAMASGWIVEEINVVRYLSQSNLASSVDLLLNAFLLEAAEK